MNPFNKVIVAAVPLVPRPLVRYFARPYIAGEHLSDAVAVVKKLNSQGIMATLDVLGESITQKEEATEATQEIIEVLNAIKKERLDANVSIKLTQLGLQLDKQFCLDNVRHIVSTARDLGNFVRIDMEDSTCTDDTLWVYREIRKQFENSGIVLQACLHRAEADAVSLIKEGLSHFRLCKGIYIEPVEIAYRVKKDVNKNYVKVLDVMLRQGAYVGIATHDSELVAEAYRLINGMKLPHPAYEFQMLLGVRPDIRAKILKDGHRVRVYVPFGVHWYKYCVRRFKENPQIAGSVLKAMFSSNQDQ